MRVSGSGGDFLSDLELGAKIKTTNDASSVANGSNGVSTVFEASGGNDAPASFISSSVDDYSDIAEWAEIEEDVVINPNEGMDAVPNYPLVTQDEDTYESVVIVDGVSQLSHTDQEEFVDEEYQGDEDLDDDELSDMDEDEDPDEDLDDDELEDMDEDEDPDEDLDDDELEDMDEGEYPDEGSEDNSDGEELEDNESSIPSAQDEFITAVGSAHGEPEKDLTIEVAATEKYAPSSISMEQGSPVVSSPVLSGIPIESESLAVDDAVYFEGMTIVDFLKKNPTLRKDGDVLTYYSADQVRVAISQGRVFRKKGKLYV